MIDSSNKHVKEFIKYLGKLNMEEFVGVARLMNINLYAECGPSKNDCNLDIKDGEQIIEEMVNKFMGYNRVRRRNLLTIIRSAAK